MPSNVIPDSHKHLLAQPILAHAATVGPKGEPQANPIWFLWDGQYIVISIGPEGQKARNLERNPRIALSMVDAENPLLYLEVRGTVASVRHVDSQDSDRHRDGPQVHRQRHIPWHARSAFPLFDRPCSRHDDGVASDSLDAMYTTTGAS